MTRILLIAAVATMTFGSFSCSKKSDGGGSNNNTSTGKAILIKITLTPSVLPGPDDISGAVNGVLPDSKLATWKVNGVTRTNESTIAFTQADFKSGVITLEATAGVTSANRNHSRDQHPATLLLLLLTLTEHPYAFAVSPAPARVIQASQPFRNRR